MAQFRGYVLWLIVGVFEIPMSVNLLWGQKFIWEGAVAAHLIAVVLAYFTPAYTSSHASPYNMGRPWSVWLTLWVLLLSGIGWLFGTVMLFGSRWGSVQTFEEDPDVMLPAEKLPQEKIRYKSASKVSSELDFVPLVEIMAGDDLDLKRSAIEQLARLRSPDAIQVLMQYRRDPQLEIRFYINSAITRIKKDFDEALQAARQQMRSDADNIDTRLMVAKNYLRYANSGLLDADMVNVYEGEAIFHLTYVINAEHPPTAVVHLLVQCYSDRQEWGKALEIVTRAKEMHLGYDEGMQQLHVQILYAMGRYTEVRETLSGMKSHGTLPQEWQTAALWWGVT